MKAMTCNAVQNETTHLTSLKDKEILEKGYFDIKAESEALIQEREGLRAELTSVKGQLQTQIERFETLELRFIQVQDSLIKANEQVSSLIARNQELCRKLEEKGGEC